MLSSLDEPKLRDGIITSITTWSSQKISEAIADGGGGGGGSLPAEGAEGEVLTVVGGSWESAPATGLAYFTEDENTSAPNATIPVQYLLATGAETHIDVALVAKGDGALMADVPDGTAAGGDKRGIGATDLQKSRSLATQVASGDYAVIVGGVRNTASGDYSFAGGYTATASNQAAFAYGNNVVASGGQAVSLGYGNVVSGGYSSAPGGRGLTLSGNGSFGYLSNDSGNNDMSVSSGDTAVFGNVDLWLVNNDNTARELRLYEANSTASGAFPPAGINYVGIKAPTLAADYTLTLPTTDGDANQVLSTDGSGTLSWATAGGLEYFTEAESTTAPNDTIGVQSLSATGIGIDIDVVIAPKGGGSFSLQVADGTAAGGNKRGVNAVDTQMLRTTADKVASGAGSALIAGSGSVASGTRSAVVAGLNHTLTGADSAALGGVQNTISGIRSGVVAGEVISVASDHSSVLGGRNLTLSSGADRTSGFHADNATSDAPMTISEPEIFVLGNADLWLANTNNSASEIRLYEAQSATGAFPAAGTNYVGIKAPALAADYTLTLPTTDGDANQVLSTDGSGTLSWATAGGLTNFTESVNTAAPNDTVPVVRLLATNAATNVDVALTPKGTGALTAQVADGTATGGNKRGTNAVDWQTGRSSASKVASGANSTIGGGNNNVTAGQYATVSGGNDSSASGTGCSVGGGAFNTANSGSYHTVAGGYANVLTNATGYCAIIGGRGLTLSGSASAGFNANTGGAKDTTVSANDTFVLANANLWLANTDNTARELRLYEAQSSTGTFPAAGINYTAFKAGAQSADITYTLPTAAPTSNGQAMVATTGGAMSWVSLGKGGAGLITGTFSKSSSTSYSDVTVSARSIAITNIGAGEHWAFQINARLTGSGGGAKFQFTVPSGAATYGYATAYVSSSSGAGKSFLVSGGEASFTAAEIPTAEVLLTIHGYIYAENAGTLMLQMAQQTSNGTATTLASGANIIGQRY